MAGKKISELQPLSEITGDEMFPVAKGGGNNSVTTNVLLKNIKDENQDLFNRLNDYMYDVSGLLGKLAYRDGVGTDLKNMTPNGYFNLKGELVDNPSTSTSSSWQYVDIDSSKIYYLKVNLIGTIISQLNLFDEEGNVIKTINKTINGYYIFQGVSKIGISGINDQNLIVQSFDIQDLTTILNTQQGNRALYVAAGAVYNEKTGFYELNGLTDITEEEMKVIYVQTHHITRQTSFAASLANTNSIRTNYPLKVVGGYRQIDTHAMFAGCVSLEVAALGIDVNRIIYPSDTSYLFQNCKKLKKVIGIIRMDYASSSLKYEKMFYQCFALVSVRLRGVKYDISFSDSPLLSLESLQYLIDNAANTSAITVTVHADVYAKIQDESNTDWHALIEAATAKQITFATA